MKLHILISLVALHLALFPSTGYSREESELSQKYTQVLDLMAPQRAKSTGEMDQEDQISLRIDMLYSTLKSGKTFSANLGLPQNKRAFEGLYGRAAELKIGADTEFDAKIYQQVKSREDKATSDRDRLDLLLLTAYLQQTYLAMTPGQRNTEFSEKILNLLKEIMTPVQFDLFMKRVQKLSGNSGGTPTGSPHREGGHR